MWALEAGERASRILVLVDGAICTQTRAISLKVLASGAEKAVRYVFRARDACRATRGALKAGERASRILVLGEGTVYASNSCTKLEANASVATIRVESERRHVVRGWK